jgi:hypothetical protein
MDTTSESEDGLTLSEAQGLVVHEPLYKGQVKSESASASAPRAQGETLRCAWCGDAYPSATIFECDGCEEHFLCNAVCAQADWDDAHVYACLRRGRRH